MRTIQTPDFIASPGLRVISTYSSGDVAGFSDILVAAGWTLLSTGTYNGFPSRKLVSASPPWWDVAATPAYYISGLKVRITGPLNFGSGDSIIFQGMSMDETVENTYSGDVPYLLVNNTYRVVANPYGCFAKVVGSIGSGKAMLLSALNTPRSMQERVQLRNVFVILGGTNFRSSLLVSDKFFAYFKSIDGEYVNASAIGGTPPPVMCLLVDPSIHEGGSAQKPLAKAYTNYGFITPAAIGWRVTGGAFRIKGWIYDSFVVSKGAAESNLLIFPDGHVGEAYTSNINDSSAAGTLYTVIAGN